jgi:glutamine transport system substrate-binding protein
MTMKRRDFIKLGLIVTPAILLTFAAKAEEAELIVGSNVGSPPFAFKKDDGYSGFDIELWAEVAKGFNRKWRVQPMEFGALIPALQTRNIDAIVSQLFIKPERQKVIDFSDPYYQSGLVAVTAADNTTIKTPQDLEGKTIGTETGTIAVDFIKEHIKGATVEQLPSINNALLALEAGRTDAVVYDTPALMYYANNAGKGKVRVIHPTLEGRDVGIGFQKGSPLVASANATLAAMKADGRLKALREKWFGADA